MGRMTEKIVLEHVATSVAEESQHDIQAVCGGEKVWIVLHHECSVRRPRSLLVVGGANPSGVEVHSKYDTCCVVFFLFL